MCDTSYNYRLIQEQECKKIILSSIWRGFTLLHHQASLEAICLGWENSSHTQPGVTT